MCLVEGRVDALQNIWRFGAGSMLASDGWQNRASPPFSNIGTNARPTPRLRAALFCSTALVGIAVAIPSVATIGLLTATPARAVDGTWLAAPATNN